MSTDTTAWSGQSCVARQESGEEVRNQSSKEAFRSEVLGKQLKKSTI